MLTQQFFTRVQLAKILNFKSDGSIKDLEKKGFLTPEIKPSKYTFNQVLFMMICKEITDLTNLSWKFFIDVEFNKLLKENLIDYDLLLLSRCLNLNQFDTVLMNDDVVVKELNDYLDGDLLKRISKLKGIENTTENIPFLHIDYSIDFIVLTISIDRVHRRLHNKCIELKIDLKEKILA
jgi:hypothetical protein